MNVLHAAPTRQQTPLPPTSLTGKPPNVPKAQTNINPDKHKFRQTKTQTKLNSGRKFRQTKIQTSKFIQAKTQTSLNSGRK